MYKRDTSNRDKEFMTWFDPMTATKAYYGFWIEASRALMSGTPNLTQQFMPTGTTRIARQKNQGLMFYAPSSNTPSNT